LYDEEEVVVVEEEEIALEAAEGGGVDGVARVGAPWDPNKEVDDEGAFGVCLCQKAV